MNPKLTLKQKAWLTRLARRECAMVLEEAEGSDGFKHRNVNELPGANDDEKLLGAADDYFFWCVAEIRKELAK